MTTVIGGTAAAATEREWTCACGQAYRVASVQGALRLWPRNGNAAYSRQGLGAGCCCIRCGRPLRADADHRADSG